MIQPERRIAVVTGANRGIGLEAANQLAKKGIHVLLTARDPEKGQQALNSLKGENLSVEFFKLEVTSKNDIESLKTYLERSFGRLDILVNNAGVFLDPRSGGKSGFLYGDPDIMRQTFETNIIGPFQLMKTLIPLMQKNNYGRIVNVSSGMGALNDMGSGYPAYRISKTALNSLTKLSAVEYEHENILINAVSPGWVKTDMGGPGANRTAEEAAQGIVWLASLPDGGPTGGFFRDKQRIPW